MKIIYRRCDSRFVLERNASEESETPGRVRHRPEGIVGLTQRFARRRFDEQRDVGDRSRCGHDGRKQRRKVRSQPIQRGLVERVAQGNVEAESIQNIGVSSAFQMRVLDLVEARFTPLGQLRRRSGAAHLVMIDDSSALELAGAALLVRIGQADDGLSLRCVR